MFEKFKQDWEDMDAKFKIILVALLVAGVVFIFIQSQKNKEADSKKAAEVASGPGPATSNAPGAKPFSWQAVPNSNRNQGLEDISAELAKLRSDLSKLQTGRDQVRPSPPTNNPSIPEPDLSTNSAVQASAGGTPKSLPPPVKFDLDAPISKPVAGEVVAIDRPGTETPLAKPTRPKMQVWDAAPSVTPPSASSPKFLLPVNAALEGVMLSGINARPTGAIGGAIGSVTSANDVGAPFVSRIKGDATLPNGWKLSDLGDCFLGGSGVAILSAERVYVISNTISCIADNGEVFEAPVKAYGLDVDGIQGLAGKVVSKQGSILLQAALTGVASGLGSALTPTPIPGYNSSAQGGAQATQTPDARTIAATAVGNGLNSATAQLSRFYLDYAREVFPVIEVAAMTRVTWIMKETAEFKRVTKGN